MTEQASWVRSAGVWVLMTGAAAALLGWLRPDLALADRPASLEAALAQGGVLVAASCVTWLWCVASLAVAEAVHLRSPASGRRSTVRHLVLIACGVALGGAVALPAQAAPGDPPQPPAAAGTVNGLALPERPTGALVLPRAVAGDRAATVVVRVGDSLWSLARQHLAPGAGDAAIDVLCRRLHTANLDVIGPDPDLILPGQRLVLPEVTR